MSESQSVTDELERLDRLITNVGEKRFELAQRVDELEKRVEELEAENEQLRQELQASSSKADAALAQVNENDETKKGLARRLTRNTLVTRALKGNSGRNAVTTSDIKKKAEGRIEDLCWMTIDRAWDDLQDNWPDTFAETKRDGTKSLTTSKERVSRALAAAVEEDMALEDGKLANRCVGGKGEGGV